MCVCAFWLFQRLPVTASVGNREHRLPRLVPAVHASRAYVSVCEKESVREKESGRERAGERVHACLCVVYVWCVRVVCTCGVYTAQPELAITSSRAQPLQHSLYSTASTINQSGHVAGSQLTTLPTKQQGRTPGETEASVFTRGQGQRGGGEGGVRTVVFQGTDVDSVPCPRYAPIKWTCYIKTVEDQCKASIVLYTAASV